MVSPLPLPVMDLGSAQYGPVQELQRRLCAAVATGACAGVLLLLEHEPVITLGSRGQAAHVLLPDTARARGVAVERSERGGAATLHAPGQLVSYPIIPLPGHDLRGYVWRLEEVLRLMLLDLGVRALRSPGRPGLYVEGRKIASLGLRCRRWVTSHGTALNLNVDLTLFDLIVSCAEPDLRQTSVAELTGRAPSMKEAKERYRRHFASVFGMALGAIQVPAAGFEPATPGSGGQCSIP